MLKNKEKMKNKWEITRKTVRYMLKSVSQEKPLLYFVYIISFLSQLLQKIQVVLLPKFLIDELVLIIEGESIKRHICLTFVYALVICGITLVTNIMNVWVGYHKSTLSEWFKEFFEKILTEKVMKMEYENMENPKMLDRLQRAKNAINQYSGGVIGILDGIYGILSNFVILMGIGVGILWMCPWLFPIQLISLSVLTLFNAKSNAIEVENYEKRMMVGRKFGYYIFHLTDVFYGKEIRLYNGLNIINTKVKKIEDEMNSVEKEVNRKQCFRLLGMDITNGIRDALSYFYVGYLALRKKIGLGDFSMCVASASELYHGVRGAVLGCQDLIKRCEYACQFIEFMDYPSVFVKREKDVVGTKHVIEFSHVYFKYPNTEDYILKDINLKISSGEHLALVGMNGMGKTTLIKLLCRLYRVTEGAILIDGVNINEYSESEFCKLFSVVFQDYQIFAFSLRENVAFKSEVDDSGVNQVLKDTGFLSESQRLPEGLDTILFKGFDDNGIELSGGQAQKVAIARALYRNSPIVILDEPTAALDPIAEHEIFSGFNRLVKDKTAIFISHRLSSCKFCDRIAVIDGGTIKEYGTHDELLQLKNGLYADMFTTQARYYVEQKSSS